MNDMTIKTLEGLKNEVKLWNGDKVALALGLGTCSKTTPIETTIQKIEEPKPIINTKDVLYKTAKVKSATSIIPTWYKTLPKEENIIYTVGSATSPNLQLAVDM